MFKLNCKDASTWLVRLQDDQLPFAIRAKLNVHLMMCHRCRGFKHQMSVLKQGVHAWREHLES